MKLIVLAVFLIAAVTVECRNLHGPRQEPPSPPPLPPLIFDSQHLDDIAEPIDGVDMEVFELNSLSPVSADGLYQVDDILLTEDQWASLRSRKALQFDQYRWTEGIDGYPFVPYFSLGPVNQTAVKLAVDHWMKHTCITFGEDTKPNQPHLEFQIHEDVDGVDGNTICQSSIGLANQTGQAIYVGSRCSLGSVIHEIGHAMGFFHEQARSDRDEYVTILTENVKPGTRLVNFASFPQYINNYSVPYDYSSLMHYGATFFNKVGKLTIVTKNPLDLELIGQRNVLSHRDKLLANRMYNCIGKWLSKCGISSDPCLNDGYTGTDCICICPPGTTGSNCEVVVGDYYDEARNPRSEEISTNKRVTVKTPMEPDTRFVKSIVPPICKMAKVSFKSTNMFDDCRFQLLHIVSDPSDMTGQTLCAEDIKTGLTITSETGIFITMFNYVSGYTFESTLWEADIRFQDIPGCTVPSSSNKTTTTPTTTLAQDPDLCSSIFKISSEWPNNALASIQITFPNTVSSWNLELTFNRDISSLIIWNLDEEITSAKTVNLTPKLWNVNQVADNFLHVNFLIRFDGSEPSKVISAKLNSDELCK